MAFINEDIPLQELYSFDFSVFRDERGAVFNLKRKFIPTWTIDRQHNAFLLWTGGGEGPEAGSPRRDCYSFWWRGDVARFSGERQVVSDARGPVVLWNKPQWDIPAHMASRRSQVMVLVQEALDVSELGTEGLLYPYSLKMASP